MNSRASSCPNKKLCPTNHSTQLPVCPFQAPESCYTGSLTVVTATGCSCLFETTVEIHSLREYNTASELTQVARKRVGARKHSSGGWWELVSSAQAWGEGLQNGGWRKGTQKWLLLIRFKTHKARQGFPSKGTNRSIS